MKSLLVIDSKLINDSILDFSKKNSCEIVIIEKSLSKTFNKSKFDKIILITEKILPRNSIIYKSLKKFVKKNKVFFVEIGYTKTKIATDKAFSDALINGTGNNTMSILKKIINIKND